MIEQFSRLRRERGEDTSHVQEVNATLENIAERSARPPGLSLPDSEAEREALLRLQDAARKQAVSAKEDPLNHLLVSIGQLPLFDQQKRLRSNLPQVALVGEVAFQPVDARQRPAGKASYRHYYLALDEVKEVDTDAAKIFIESESLVPVVDGLLSDPVPSVFLGKKRKAQVQALLALLLV